MKSGTSRLFELQPDPYDTAQKRFFRVCLFADVKNAAELRQALVDGSIDAALIRPELVRARWIELKLDEFYSK